MDTLPLGKFLGYLSHIRTFHWNADTKTNEHNALGKLYDQLDELLDTYVETYIGKCGGKVTDDDLDSCGCTDNGELVDYGCQLVDESRVNFEAGDDDDMLNILADMETALNKARYFLKTGPEPEEEGENEEETETVATAKEEKKTGKEPTGEPEEFDMEGMD